MGKTFIASLVILLFLPHTTFAQSKLIDPFAEWITHCNLSIGIAGPYTYSFDNNVYALNLVDDNSVTHPYYLDENLNPPLFVSLYASLQMPVYYDDIFTVAFTGDVNYLFNQGIFFGMAGGLVSFKAKPIAFFISGGIALFVMDKSMGPLAGNNYGFPVGTTVNVRGHSPISGMLGAGVNWYFLDWMFIKLQYSFYFNTRIADFTYNYSTTSSPITPNPTNLDPIILPQHSFSLSIGFGLL